jgi:beta-phosphoglucomutase-like phosphatase (HAD superfamily)
MHHVGIVSSREDRRCHHDHRFTCWLSSSSSSDENSNYFANDNDEKEEEENQEQQQPQRKRDKLRDWMYGGNKEMVKRIGIDGRPIEPPPARVRANFADLFAGMPSMQDIIGGLGADDDIDDAESLQDKVRDSPSTYLRRKSQIDDSWYEEEKKSILENYEGILQEMLAKLERERMENQESVPENAESMIRSVLKQEMDLEIKTTRDRRIDEMLKEYEKNKYSQLSDMEDKFEPNESVKKLMEESEEEFQQKEANRLEMEDFLRYEQEAVLRITEDNIKEPAPGQDLDAWALERLREMVEARMDVDGQEMTLYNLEENVELLEKRMQKKEMSRPIQPENMKEWQMYRSIATNLERQADKTNSQDDERSRENKILRQLNSWKEYIEREEGIRKQSGLSRGPRLPFEWQEAELSEPQMPDANAVKAQDRAAKIKVRKDLNRMSIEAMESLLEKTDPARRERLQKELNFLKAELEKNDYLDIDESAIDEIVKVGPVDTSNLFRSYLSDDEDDDMDDDSAYEPPGATITPFEIKPEMFQSPPSEIVKPHTPETPFFADDFEQRKVPQPSTPFFAGDEGYDLGETFTGDSKLGTMEDQKLEAMYRQAKARTTEEREAIRSQYEAFKDFEKQRREESGLSGDVMEDSEIVSEANLKYSISDIMREDGDFDAEKILSAIGPRPKRKRKEDTSPQESTLAGGVKSNSIGRGEATNVDQNVESDVDQNEVMDSLYRSVAAVGGGRYKDDPGTAMRQKLSFIELMKAENQMRETLENELEVMGVDDGLPSPGDDEKYAEEVLSSLGARPKPRRARIIDEGDFSDKGGILAFDDEESDEIEDDDGVVDEMIEKNDVAGVDLMPEWLRKEIEETKGQTRKTFLGSEIDEVFDDDSYEHNMRQLAEYERRRAGSNRRQMGIDISDVLGSKRFDTDDYADYKFEDSFLRGRQSSWGSESFQKRKSNLLEYIELDVQELNLLMDHKDSVYSTGVSQYLPRINKPFKDFGAIFRLEGVLVDITGLQSKAWTKVAESFGFKEPQVEDIKRAAVTHPEVAVRDLFGWTNNFLECREIAALHKQIFREVFKEWASGIGISARSPRFSSESRGNIALGQEIVDETKPVLTDRVQLPSNEADRITILSRAWERTAKSFEKEPPTREDIVLAANLSPDIAAVEIFKWSNDPLQIDDIARQYRNNLKAIAAGIGVVSRPLSSFVQTSRTTVNPAPSRALTKNDVMEMHYRAWASIAEQYGFNLPSSDEVLAAFVINDPETAIQGFGWTDDRHESNIIAQSFQATLNGLTKGGQGGSPTEVNSEKREENWGENQSLKPAPTPDEIFQLSFDTWTAIAKKTGLAGPDAELVQFALTVGPEEAITVGFGWAEPDNKEKIAKFLNMYKEELAKRQPSWIASNAFSQSAIIKANFSGSSHTTGPSMDEIYKVAFNAWTVTAAKLNMPAPDDEQIQFAMTVGPEEAIATGFGWTDIPEQITRVAAIYKDEVGKLRKSWKTQTSDKFHQNSERTQAPQMIRINDGGAKWISSLLNVEMQCGIVSYLEHEQVDILMEQAGLAELIPPDKRVSSSNGYVTDKDQILGVALRLERRPDHCALFDTSPYASVAAHDVEMRSVSLITSFPRYELLSADMTTSSFDGLTAMNIRRLFGERVYDQPLADSQQIQPETQRRTKTKYFFDDE